MHRLVAGLLSLAVHRLLDVLQQRQAGLGITQLAERGASATRTTTRQATGRPYSSRATSPDNELRSRSTIASTSGSGSTSSR